MRVFKHLFSSLLAGTLLLASVTFLRAGDEEDVDRDGLTTDEEMHLGTDPHNRDTDGDHFPDGFEHQKGSSPLDPLDVPNLLRISVSRDNGQAELVLAVETFFGKNFQIEHCPVAREWLNFGPAVVGDGGLWKTRIPLAQAEDCGFFRVRFSGEVKSITSATSPVNGRGGGANLPTVASDGGNGNGGADGGEGNGDCDAPDSIADMSIELIENGKKRLFYFDTNGTGHLMHQLSGDYEFTPFTFTWRNIGNCRIEIVITYPTDEGESEVEIIRLSFDSETNGTFTGKFYENGELEDESEGDFKVIPPDDLPFEAWPLLLGVAE